MMKRLDNWPALLNTFFEKHKSNPGKWGEADCCMFACDAILAITGTDIAADVRGKYDTEDSAKEMLKERGGLNKLATTRMASYSCEIINRNFAQRGDLVLIDTPNGDALGIINLRGTVTGQGEFMLVDYLIDTVKKAWRIK